MNSYLEFGLVVGLVNSLLNIVDTYKKQLIISGSINHKKCPKLHYRSLITLGI